MKITVCAYKKNAHKLKRPSYYARVKVDGHVRDIPLHTDSKDVAEAWVRLRRAEIQRYQDYILAGEEPPSDLLSKLFPQNTAEPVQVKVVTIREAVDQWERQMRRTGKRETTISTYLRSIKAVLGSADDLPITSLTEDMICDRMAPHDSLKAATRKNYSVATHELLKFIVRKYGINPRIIDSVPLVKVEEMEKPYWKPFQVSKIIDAVQCRDKVMEQTAKAYYWFLFTTGARQGEAYMVEWSDLTYTDPVTAYVTIRAENTKTNHTRRVPLDWRITRLLSKLPKEGPKVFQALPKSQAGRYSILAKAIKRSGMPKGGLHTFRRSFCTLAYGKSDDVKALAEMVGHSPEVGLKTYIAVRQQDQLREVVDKTFEGETMLPSPIQELAELDLL